MNEELARQLAQAIVEIQEHNRDYQYSTARALLADMRATVEREIPGFDWSTLRPEGRWSTRL